MTNAPEKRGRHKRGDGGLRFGSLLTITSIGQRGEGIAELDGRTVYVPHALPGETVRADIDGERAELNEIVKASPERIEPICEYYGVCGGCALQVMLPAAYRQWKQNLVRVAIQRAQLDANLADLVLAHGDGRRRVTLHARQSPAGLTSQTVAVGFMRARSHDIVDILRCPILCDALERAPEIGRAIAMVFADVDKPLDVVLTETITGVDVDIRGAGRVDNSLRIRLTQLAQDMDLARISIHGDTVIERRMPRLRIGTALVTPPPGAFLQATLAGEAALSQRVLAASAGSKFIADLFAGIGTFALRLAEIAPVHAVEHDKESLLALDRAARFADGLKPVSVETRDLFRRPMRAEELTRFDCVVFDPPRAGAQAQAVELAASDVPLVIGVSCNPGTFTRDARILVDAGYQLETVMPVDQFLFSPHVEMIGIFRKQRVRKARRLLG